MNLGEILSKEEIEDYHNQWGKFGGKYKVETPYSVHSSFPVIGRVFQYNDKPIFRAKILKKPLKRIDPYFLGKKGYIHANFHLTHYFLPIEQIVHSAMPKLMPDYNNFIITDKFGKNPPQMNSRVHFDKSHPSIELIANVTRSNKKFVLRVGTTFYEDRENKALQKWYFDGVGVYREYVDCIEKLKEEFTEETTDQLIKKIENQYIRHQRLTNPRRSIPEKDDLIERIRNGSIPEDELHDFFSFWDPD